MRYTLKHKCCVCGEYKLLSEFCTKKDAPLGLSYDCKVCRKLYIKTVHKIKKRESEHFYNPEILKTCTKCNITKKNSSFSRHARGKHYTRAYCIDCEKKALKR